MYSFNEPDRFELCPNCWRPERDCVCPALPIVECAECGASHGDVLAAVRDFNVAPVCCVGVLCEHS